MTKIRFDPLHRARAFLASEFEFSQIGELPRNDVSVDIDPASDLGD